MLINRRQIQIEWGTVTRRELSFSRATSSMGMPARSPVRPGRIVQAGDDENLRHHRYSFG